MTEKEHWRKTAKQCPKCFEMRSKNSFLPGLQSCIRCEFDNVILKDYKVCKYCKNIFPKEEFKTALCSSCKKLHREKHSKNKHKPQLERGKKYKCTQCELFLNVVSFARGNDITNLICRKCETNLKITQEGKFRCRGCCSVFPKNIQHWNKYCERCYKKNLIWNREKAKELRKDPYWQQYFRDYSRYYYHNVFKQIYNKVFALQWEHGLLKPRKVNRNGFWYVLNRALFDDFRKRPGYWFSLTEKVINQMRTGKENNLAKKYEDERHPYVKKWSPDEEWDNDT